jgi:SAM-dependent methyltransferase
MHLNPEYGTKQWFDKAYAEAGEEVDPWGVSIRGGMQVRLESYISFIKEHISGEEFSLLKNFLDIGCALGDFSAKINAQSLQHLNLAGDITPNVLQNAKERFDYLKYCAMALPNLPLKEQSFDFVSCISVLCYPSPQDRSIYLQEMYRVIKPGGYIFLEVPVGDTPFFSSKEFFDLTSRKFNILEFGYLYGRYFFFIEGFFFRVNRKLDKLGHRSGVGNKLWRFFAKILEIFIRIRLWAYAFLYVGKILKIGTSHVYLLGQKKYEDG